MSLWSAPLVTKPFASMLYLPLLLTAKTLLRVFPSQIGLGPLKDALGWAISEFIDRIGQILRGGFEALVTLLAEALDVILEPVLEIMLYAPAPETGGQVFAPPTNAPWTEIFGPLWASMVPLGLAILVVSYFASEGLSTLSIGFGDQGRVAEREFGLVVGLFAIPLSRYVITLYLQTMRALTHLLTPGDMVSLSDIARYDADTAALAIILMAFLSGLVYVVVLAMHIFRIVGVILLAGAAPILLALYLGRFPVLDGVSKSLLRVLPVLGFAPVLLALAMRVMTAIFAADGSISIDGIGVASVVIEPLFLLAPGLLGIVLPSMMIRSASSIGAPSSAGVAGKTRTPKTASKATTAGKKTAKKGGAKAREAPSRVQSRVEQRRVNRSVDGGPNGDNTDSGSDQSGDGGGPDDSSGDDTASSAGDNSGSDGISTPSRSSSSNSPPGAAPDGGPSRRSPKSQTGDSAETTPSSHSGSNGGPGSGSAQSADGDTSASSSGATPSESSGAEHTATSPPAAEASDSSDDSPENKEDSQDELSSLRSRDPVSRAAAHQESPAQNEPPRSSERYPDDKTAENAESGSTGASDQTVAEALRDRFGRPDDDDARSSTVEDGPARSSPDSSTSGGDETSSDTNSTQNR